MVISVDYGDFLSIHAREVVVTNDMGQSWALKRAADISESEVKECLGSFGKTEGIKVLLEEGKLIPVYGGDMHLF